MDLYLIDGNSYLYRAFYAIKGLTNSKGLPTNAVYGFTTMLLKIMRERKPQGLAVSFDSAAPTQRHKLFRDYKAHRPETPSDLLTQFPHVRKIISAFHIPIFEVPGYEADDVIGTIAKKAAREGATVFIVTADKDMLQLVNEHIKMFDPVKDKVLDKNYVKDKFGVGPERIPEFMALTGDSVDNIPGVKGVGEKTAKELLLTFENLDDLLYHADRIKKEKLRSMISDSKDLIRLSFLLATIDSSVPLDFDMDDLTLQEPDWLSLFALFREFEFSSLMKLVPAAKPAGKTHETVNRLDRLKDIILELNDEFAIDTEATGRDPLTENLVGIALCSGKEKACYIPVAHRNNGEQIPKQDVISAIRMPLQDEDVSIIGHNLKYDIMLLEKEDIQITGKLFDTMLASYLLNPTRPSHSLDNVSLEYLSKRKESFPDVLKKRATFADVPISEAAHYAAEDAALSYELKKILFQKLKENSLEQVYFDIEMPLIRVLVEMEKTGIKLDVRLLQDLSGKLATEIESIQNRIFFLAGEKFNINSPKQLGVVLFHNLGLSPGKKTKTGFSTGMDVLEELAESHELPGEVLNYRSLTKLKTTYLDVLPAQVNPVSGRIHTSFNQTVTATGRLSSSNPNLQNIPVRGEWGRRIRQAFIAEEGNILLSADYSQVELRILAHLSGDDGLNDAFTKEIDIHSRTASELFGVPVDKVTDAMRRTAKTVNFGVIYGISAFGLSETLNIEREDANKYINQYFDRHRGVKEYTERVLHEAREKGYVTTLMGRKRPVPELSSRNRNIRMQGERFAVNSPIQGTAADIIKIAMINIRKKLISAGSHARMLLQVHDELLFETPESEIELVRRIITEEMENAITLSVPLKVQIGCGSNWAEAHS